jgi:adenosylcobinamide-phosphate synthase
MVAHNLILMAAALLLDALLGDPVWLYRRIPHPVVWMGNLLSAMEKAFNGDSQMPAQRILAGAMCLFVLLAIFGAPAWLLSHFLSHSILGWAMLALLASTLLAQRSLYDHVHAVAAPLAAGDVAGARAALALIVGRDVQSLDSAAVSGAATESLAENLSDGVVAPLFWGCLLGLPGLVLYKAINTADSMIGHRTPRYLYFGRVAARLDDLVNLVPARLTGLLIACVSLSATAWTLMLADARKHRSPNAGWPEAAMAGALNVRLSGPRAYHGVVTDEPWINRQGAAPDTASIKRALRIMIRACIALLLVTLVLYFMTSGSPATISST